MTQALDTQRAPISALAMTQEQREIVRRAVFPGANNDELALYVHDCHRQGVHPLDRLIHPTIRGTGNQRRYTPITSIDLMRSRAEATGEYAGNDEPVFIGTPKADDFMASVTVYRIVAGVRCAFTATARWVEYKPEGGAFMWNRMPHTMLGKCAEALALRKAFPRNLSGLYAKEEMDQAGVVRVEAQPAPALEEGQDEIPLKPPPETVVVESEPFNRKAAIADLVEASKTGGEVRKAIEEMGFPAGRKWADWPDSDLLRLLDRLWPRNA